MKKQMAIFIATLLATNLFAQLTIYSVSPSSAVPGTTGTTITFTLPDTTPPTPPVHVTPTRVMIGTLAGSSIHRTSMDTVTAVFDIPADETESTKDCSITFPGPEGDVTLTKTSGFTVGDATTPEQNFRNGPPASGYNLFSPINSTETYLIDNEENIIKTWTSTYTPGNSMYLLDDASLLRTANSGSMLFNEGGAGGRIEQYTWNGTLTWAFDYDTSNYRQHHDIEVLPNGNILMIAWELKTQAETIAQGRNTGLLNEGELWPDHIIEVAPTGSYGGIVVWEWHTWDHLIQDHDSEKPNYGVVEEHPEKINLNYAKNGKADWHHINSIDYNEELDQILLSVHNFSEIWIIDHNTTTEEAAGSAGDLLYRWGNPAAYGGSGEQQLFVQHDAKWIESNLPGGDNILIFNNGQGRPEGDYSSVDEIAPPIAQDGTYTNGLPLTPVWSYTNTIATNFYASHISGAMRLKNGNTLICEGTAGYAFEVTDSGELVWNYTASAELFRFERYAPDFEGFENTKLALPTVTYAIVDTAQDQCYDNSSSINAPETNSAFYGQDAQMDGHQPCYELNPDRTTVYDYNTRLTWTRSPDWTQDGVIDIHDKMTQSQAASYVDSVNIANFGGYSDWRLPTIKEIYSLMDFRGTDPMNDDTSTLAPFINSNYFEFAWGDTANGERTIDSQVATSTLHIDPVMGGNIDAMPGINIVDGRIKGYPVTKVFLVYLCRGNTNYGENVYTNNNDGTITDRATGLMWAQDDSESDMLWSNALAYAQQMNRSNYLGYNDWRLPNAKELQSIVDYSRAPGATGSAAIDPLFNCTPIDNENGEIDWPWYFTGTTHARQDGTGSSAVYICFGRAIGYWNNTWEDVHGPGSQRSDSKAVNTTGYTYISDGWYFTNSPQGDASRWYNYVRLVRDAKTDNTTTPNMDSDDDGLTDTEEQFIGSDPDDPTSTFTLSLEKNHPESFTISWPTYNSGLIYTLKGCTNLVENKWFTINATTSSNLTLNTDAHTVFYRIYITEDR